MGVGLWYVSIIILVYASLSIRNKQKHIRIPGNNARKGEISKPQAEFLEAVPSICDHMNGQTCDSS